MPEDQGQDQGNMPLSEIEQKVLDEQNAKIEAGEIGTPESAEKSDGFSKASDGSLSEAPDSTNPTSEKSSEEPSSDSTSPSEDSSDKAVNEDDVGEVVAVSDDEVSQRDADESRRLRVSCKSCGRPEMVTITRAQFERAQGGKLDVEPHFETKCSKCNHVMSFSLGDGEDAKTIS